MRKRTGLRIGLACVSVGLGVVVRPGSTFGQQRATTVPVATAAAGGALSPAELFKRISPSVVRIMVNDAKGEPMGQGSGFVATANGLVVTNYHVIKGGRSLAVFLEGNKQL